jgi:hypothetical protein
MATAYTSLLGLALPVTGELSGNWGDTVNTAITSLLDSAISGTTTLSADADVTLTTSDGVANEARQAILLWTAGGSTTRNITAPAQSKAYFVINKTSSTQSIVIRGAGPTTGVTVRAGQQSLVVWDGVDFVEVASGDVDGPSSATDNAVARFDGTTGKLIQNSVVTIADSTGNMAGVGTLGVGAITTSGALTYGGVTLNNAVTGTGDMVLSTSPTLVTPALGTPSALVGTNITGTAAGLTAGNVTTNANLTGAITSTGNATLLGSFSSANLAGALTDETGTGSAVFATSPTLVTPALGTPASGVVTNLTGTASININGTVGATTASTGAFTTLTTSSTVTLNGGTANGVAFLDASKVLTTGSALTFNGINALVLSASTASSALVTLDAPITGNSGLSNQILFRDTGTDKWALGGSNIGLAAQNSFGIYNYATSTIALTIDSATNNWTIPTGSFTVQNNAVFNESGGDFDFRVESDTDTHALFVDAGNNRIGMGASSPATSLHVQRSSGATLVRAEVAAGSEVGFDIVKTGATTQHWRIADGVVANGTLEIYDVTNSRSNFRTSSTQSIFNENGADIDFRVESDNNTHMLFVDAGTNQVTMGQSTPRADATLTLGYWGSSSENNAQLSVDANANSGTGQATLELLAGSGSSNRASRINFLNGVTSTTVPRWILINDFDQGGVNDFRLVNASVNNLMTFTQTGGVVFNEDSIDYDFRVESDTNTHALFVDAGLSTVCVNGTGATSNTDIAGFQNLSGNGVLSGGGGFPFVALSRTQNEATANNATTDAFRFLDHNSAVFGTSALAGKFYINATGASGANQFNAIYNVLVCGDGVGTGSSVFALETSITRGTSPVDSVALVDDGVGGGVKVQITYIDNSGVVTGGTSRVTFIGQTSTT